MQQQRANVSGADVRLPVSVVFHHVITEETTVYCCSFMAEGMLLNPAACTVVLCWTGNRERSESGSVVVVWKLDPTEHILVFQMNHQQGAVCNMVVPFEENLIPAQFWAN